MKILNPLTKYIRPDIPSIFNEIFILKNHLDRFNYVLNNNIILPPYEVLVHLCSQCNLCCKWCIGGRIIDQKEKATKKLGALPSTLAGLSNIEKLINNLLNYKKEIETIEGGKKIKTIYKIENVSFSGITGDPLLAKKSLIRAIELLARKKIRLGVYTNGTLLDSQLIDELLKIDYVNVSIDAGSSGTYSKLKYQADKEGEVLFNGLIKRIKELINARNRSKKSKLQVNASYVLYPDNYKEVYRAAKLLKDIGIENFRIKQDNSGKNLLSEGQMREASRLLNKIEDLVDNKFKFIKIHRLNNISEMDRRANSCLITDLMAAVGSDGKVYPCNYHPRVDGYSYGNAITTSFQAIWEGKERKKIKKMLPLICPQVCDPFKLRANSLFEEIKNCRLKYGKDKTNIFIAEIIKHIK